MEPRVHLREDLPLNSVVDLVRARESASWRVGELASQPSFLKKITRLCYSREIGVTSF